MHEGMRPISAELSLDSSWMRSQSRYTAAAYIAAVIVAVLHVGQSIWLKNGIPGDLADARLVNCLLEHIYQWIGGHADLFSPSQFYPTRGTLVYCDNHFGTALLYAAFRVCGASMERAFQLWVLSMLAANAVALSFLFRRLRIHPLIGLPLIVFGTSSFALVFKAGHPQTLPMFPFIMSLAFFLQFLRSADAKQLCWSLLWFGYQHACYFYYGYFTGVLLLGLFVIMTCLWLRRDWWQRFSMSVKAHWPLLLSSLAVVLILLITLYAPYSAFAKHSGTRSIEDLRVIAPNLGAWFSASPFSLFYSHQTFYKPGANVAENSLFAGWGVWVVLVCTIAFTLCRRRLKQEAALASSIIIVCLLSIAFITSWGSADHNLYVKFAERLPSIRALRAFTRIAYLLIVLEACAAALALNLLYKMSMSGLVQTLAIFTSFAIGFESLSAGQPYYLKATSQKRRIALEDAWRNAGAREVLVFAPGFTNQPSQFVNTDCWQVALSLHKFTMNGYSGNEPPTYSTFLHAPTIENAHALLSILHLDESRISIVRDWPHWAREQLGVREYHTPEPVIPTTSIAEIHCAPSQEASVPVVIVDNGHEELDCDMLKIFASYRIYDANGVAVTEPPSIRTSVHTLHPTESLQILMKIKAPPRRGIYKAKLSMVHEGVAWWADRGFAGSTISLMVE